MRDLTTVPALVTALHDEALAIAQAMRQLTDSAAPESVWAAPAILNLSAAPLVMRIALLSECLGEFRGELAARGIEGARDIAVAHAALMEEPFSALPARSPVAFRALDARQTRLEERYAWLCRALRGAAAPIPDSDEIIALMLSEQRAATRRVQ